MAGTATAPMGTIARSIRKGKHSKELLRDACPAHPTLPTSHRMRLQLLGLSDRCCCCAMLLLSRLQAVGLTCMLRCDSMECLGCAPPWAQSRVWQSLLLLLQQPSLHQVQRQRLLLLWMTSLRVFVLRSWPLFLPWR